MRKRRRNGLGAYVLVLAIVIGTAAIATVVVGKNRRTLYSTTERFHRHIVSNAFDPISAAERGLLPTATSTHRGGAHAGVRAIVVHPGRIVLLAAGKPVRTIAMPRSPATLRAIVRSVRDPDWLSESHGIVTLRAAVIADRGSVLRVSAPLTREVVLTRRAGVFLGARHARLRLDGVDVRSGPVGTTDDRPFVVAQRSSTMVIRGSSFRDLGHDWNSSYGVTWASGSGGRVVDSRFANCYIAIYTDAAHDLLIRGNVLRRNTLYGIDPHSHSGHITVVGNLSEQNGRHGIIFSQDVTASLVRGNTARENHLNGIMMDASSTGNVITDNVVEHNHGDGVVLADSADNTVTSNRIRGNRVGILVRGANRQRLIRGNDVSGNALAAQGVTLTGNAVQDNGGEWEPERVAAIWFVAVPLTALLWWLTFRSRRSRDRRQRLRAAATA
ncbi:MAG TPA: right-handed parallel beta-helix repeat-containing protein [Gaiellaceae bacterium]